jgi:oligopeptide transport system permease protein
VTDPREPIDVPTARDLPDGPDPTDPMSPETPLSPMEPMRSDDPAVELLLDPEPSRIPGTGFRSEDAPSGMSDGLNEVLPVRSFRQDSWRRFKQNKLAMFGLGLVVFLTLVAIIGPFLVQDPLAQERLIFKSGPDSTHWFGTDQVGRDVFARVIYGIRLSLFIGLVVTLLETIIGVSLGALAGWRGRLTDSVIMRIIDILLGIPYLVLAFAFIAVIGKGTSAVIITLAITSWLTTARLVRAGFLQAKQFEYVEAARAVGVPSYRIVWRHILPNIVQPIIVLVAIGIGSAVLAEAALSYLGVGVQEPTPSLGLMISRSQSFFSTSPHLLLFPALAIVLTVLSFLLVGDGLRDPLDVKES